MNGKRSLQFIPVILLIALLLTGCGGTSAADIAVCDAYQQLVDAWPANSAEVDAAGSSDEVWEAITDAGDALITVSKAAEGPELGQAGQRVGETVSNFINSNSNIIAQGFVPFFNENFVGGSELGQLCEEIGEPITLP